MLPWTTVTKSLLWYTRIYDNCGAPVAMLSMCVCVCACVCVISSASVYFSLQKCNQFCQLEL